MKTVSQVAKELKVTPQAIYKRIKNPLETELHKYVSKNDKGNTLIDKEGIALLKKEFSPADKQTVNNSVDSELIAMLKAELDAKNRQIEALGQQVLNMQVLLKNEQERTLMIEHKEEPVQNEKEPAKGFFSRLFKG